MPVGGLEQHPKASRMWEAVYRAQRGRGLSRKRSAASAWSTVKKVGYYQGDDGEWHAPGNPHGEAHFVIGDIADEPASAGISEQPTLQVGSTEAGFDCDTITNALGGTASDPCEFPLYCNLADFQAWDDAIEELSTALEKARARLNEAYAAVPEEKKPGIAKLAVGIQSWLIVARFRRRAPTFALMPVYTREVLQARDRAVEGCAYLRAAIVVLRAYDFETEDLIAQFKRWKMQEEERGPGPRWGVWAGIGLGGAALAALGWIGWQTGIFRRMRRRRRRRA